MNPLQRRRFWINWFIGGIGVSLGGFGIGLRVGGAWMFFWPVDVKLISATGGLLVTISVILMGKSGKYLTELSQRRQQQKDDADELR